MSKNYIIVLAVVLALAIGAWLLLGSRGEQLAQAPEETPEPPIMITAKGVVQPVRQSRLSFRTAGQIATLPKVGDQVVAGQEIARLDTAELDLAVTQAEDAVAVAQAMLDQAQAPARPVDLAAAKAAEQGALARHNQLLAGPSGAEVAAAESAVANAQAALAAAMQRQAALDPASQPRTTETRAAELALEAAQNTLWGVQIDRDATKGFYGADSAQGKAADARVAAAESAVSQAKAALEASRLPPSDHDQRAAAGAVAAAQADLDAAQARLARLRAGATAAEKEASAAGIAEARAAIELRQAGPSLADVAVLKARLKQAQTALDQARAARRAAIIAAPFAGSIVWASGSVGETVSPGAPVVAVADLAELQVETTDLDEAAAALLSGGLSVKVTVNAIPDRVLRGTITAIAPLATTTPSGDANYTVTIALTESDPALRLGMTTRVEFPVARP